MWIGAYQCNEMSITLLDLSRYSMLKTLRISSYSFQYVNEMKLIGMNALESVLVYQGSLGKASLEMKRILIHSE